MRSFTKLVCVGFTCLSILLVTGCGTTAKFIYPSSQRNLIQISEKPMYDVEVAVLPFEDNREDRNNSGGYWLYLIPLMPFGHAQYDRPDGARMFNTISEFNFNVQEDLAKAAATSLRRSGLFKDVYFTYGGDKKDADFVLTGSIESTRYEGKLYSYGLSVYGPALWFLGIPAGSSYNELALKLELRKNDSNKTIWDYSFIKDERIIQGLYYRYGHDCKAYVTLMEEGMNEVVQSLNKKLSTVSLKTMK